MIGLLTPSAKDPQAQSGHGIVANGGYNMDSDTAALPELVKEKKKKNRNATKEKNLKPKQNKGIRRRKKKSNITN